MKLMFFYGSLKRGYWNNRLLANSEFVGDAKTVDKFKLIDLGSFPGMIGDGQANVRGEVFDVPDADVPRLDMLEGHPNFYKRTPIKVELDGKIVDVETYILQGRQGRYQDIGDFWPATK
jgi:gamma-glutamylaminecyclotransferase